MDRCGSHGNALAEWISPVCSLMDWLEEDFMIERIRAVRGRVPSIESAIERAHELRKGLRTLAGDMGRLEARLKTLDALYKKRQNYYRKTMAEAAHLVARAPRNPGQALRGRGPNVCEVAYVVLKKHRGQLPIQKLADLVIREKGGDPGANFVQNLGAALLRDRRFRRIARGVYGLKRAG